MRLLVLQQVPCEGPGVFADFMHQAGIAFDTVVLSAGQRVPSLSRYRALVVLGGPMNVYQEQEYPFLAEEGQAIARALAVGMPYLGVCLGGQLLAKALSAQVTANPVAEVGFYDIELTEAGRRDPLFRGLGPKVPVFQWHQDTFAIPRGAVRLAGSSLCPNQAFRYASNAYALQFHLETTADMIKSWTEEYKADLDGGQDHRLLAADVAASAGRLLEPARTLFASFLSIALG
ncbi:MAG: type 1 glutamine amidotransferase [Chloroflexi bacterium]|nr:type 1 glutamine amidotransferase [Chloroflexota bacterium]